MVDLRLYLDSQLTDSQAEVVDAFEDHSAVLAHDDVRQIHQVVGLVRPRLHAAGFRTSGGSRGRYGVDLPGVNGVVRCEAFHPVHGTAVWVETGRAWTNFGFLQHAVEAAISTAVVDVVLAVRSRYNEQSTFDRCDHYLTMLFDSRRLAFPYRSLVLLGF